jgi:hypothetical protein
MSFKAIAVTRRSALATMLAILPLACTDQGPVDPSAVPGADAMPTPGALQLSTQTSRGLVRLHSPTETPGPPVYASVAKSPPGPFDIIQTDGAWVGIDFLRDPACPQLAGFNLLAFLDFPTAFECPLTVDVTEWWLRADLATAGGPWGSPPSPTFRTPVEARYVGSDVPIYFVQKSEFDAATTDGVLTVAELESLASLRIGHADHYEFVQINSSGVNSGPSARAGHSRLVSHGTLEGGGTFQFDLTDHGGTISIKIAFR